MAEKFFYFQSKHSNITSHQTTSGLLLTTDKVPYLLSRGNINLGEQLTFLFEATHSGYLQIPLCFHLSTRSLTDSFLILAKQNQKQLPYDDCIIPKLIVSYSKVR